MLYVPFFSRLVKMRQVNGYWKFMEHLETCLLIAEAVRVLCHLMMVLNVFSHWIYKMKCSSLSRILLFMASLFIEFMVEKFGDCENQRKSDFPKIYFTLLDAWELSVEKPQAILTCFTWWLSGPASRLVSLSNYASVNRNSGPPTPWTQQGI